MSQITPAAHQGPAEQRAFYEEQGFLVFPELLDPAELAELRAALAEVLREAADLTESNEKFWVAPGDDGRHHVIRVLQPIERHRAFYELVFNPKILDVVENLIGPNIQLRNSTLNLKPPSQYATWKWHQDYPFFPHTNFDLLAVMIYLDDSTRENGCLTVIPGSHKDGPRNFLFPRHGVTGWQLEDRSVLADRSRWLDLPVPAGGMELHHCNLLHGSRASRNNRPRSAMVIWYRAADNVQLAGQSGHFGWGLQVRGVNPGVVRMVEGVLRLPGALEDPPARNVG